MKTIICRFKSDGNDVRKTAILNDTLDKLSQSKKNEATDIMEAVPYNSFKTWSIYFEVSESLGYEVEFKYDRENHVKTLESIKAITWGGDYAGFITDSQTVSVTVRHY